MPYRLALNRNVKLLIVNGWSAHAQLWAPFIEGLPEGVQAIVIDLDKCHSSASWGELIDSHVDCDTLILGWSLGGALAIDYAASTFKNFMGLCTVQTNLCFVERQDWPHGMAKAVFSQFYSLVEKDQKDKLVRQFSHLLTEGSDSYKSDIRQLKSLYHEQVLPDLQVLRSGLDLLRDLDVRKKLSLITVPCRHLYGKRDALVPSEVLHEVQLMAPNHKFVMIPGMGHLPCLSYQTEVRTNVMDMLVCDDA